MVTTKEICDYATATPHNTNASVLKSLIDQHDEDIRAEGGGSSYAGTLVYKGTKDTFDELPSEGNRIGDVWYIMSDSQEYVWLNLPAGQNWEKLGPSGTVTNHMTKVNLQQGSWENNKLKISNEIFKSGEQFLYFVSPADSTKEEYLRAEITAISVDDLGMIFDCIKQPQTDVIVEIARLDMKEMVPGPGPDPKPEVIPVNRIIMNPTALEMTEGETTQLKATVEPSNATNKTLTWESNSASATVQAGLVHARKEGKAVISAISYNGKRASCTVNVLAAVKPSIPISSVTVMPAELKLKVGNKSQLQATIEPQDATDKKLIWSSNSQHVTVQEGMVTAVSAGTAEVKAIATNNKFGTCNIIVEEDTAPIIPFNCAKISTKATAIDSLSGRKNKLPLGVTADVRKNELYRVKCHIKYEIQEVEGTRGNVYLWPRTIMSMLEGSSHSAWNVDSIDTIRTIESDLDVQLKCLADDFGGLSTSFLELDDSYHKGIFTISNLEVYHVLSDGTLDPEPPEAGPEPILPNSIELDKKAVELSINESIQLTPTILPKEATDKKVTWTSNNEHVQVLEGLVKGISEGTATVTASTSNGKTAICEVKVIDTSVLHNYATKTSSVVEASSLNKDITAIPLRVRGIVQKGHQYQMKCHLKVTPMELTAKQGEYSKFSLWPRGNLYSHPDRPQIIISKVFKDTTPWETEIDCKMYCVADDLFGKIDSLVTFDITNMSCSVEITNFSLNLFDEQGEYAREVLPLPYQYKDQNLAVITSSSQAVDTITNGRNIKLPMKVTAKVEAGKKYLVSAQIKYDVNEVEANQWSGGNFRFWPKGLLTSDTASPSVVFVINDLRVQPYETGFCTLMKCVGTDLEGTDMTLLTCDDERHKGTLEVSDLVVYEIL